MRPPLPEGPYLVVGLARSGTAAARMLRAHGEVIAVDSGAPEVPDDIDAHLRSDGVELLDGVACVVKSPGVPNEAPVIEAAREREILLGAIGPSGPGAMLPAALNQLAGTKITIVRGYRSAADIGLA
ncbi:MAG TPA: hypothetical protein VF351_10720, partial [Actinomycetota bacterium]